MQMTAGDAAMFNEEDRTDHDGLARVMDQSVINGLDHLQRLSVED